MVYISKSVSAKKKNEGNSHLMAFADLGWFQVTIFFYLDVYLKVIHTQ